MDIKRITPFLAVSSQISPSDVGILASQGYRGIICHRPDAESEHQPFAREIQEAAERVGLEFVHQPVTSGKVTDNDVLAFNELLEYMTGPVLAYCASGTRSSVIWALGQAGTQSTDEILEAVTRAGYDLSAMRPTLDAVAAAKG